jgi:CHAT domain-containing protein/Tfp pilus assembly protein PilF
MRGRLHCEQDWQISGLLFGPEELQAQAISLAFLRNDTGHTASFQRPKLTLIAQCRFLPQIALRLLCLSAIALSLPAFPVLAQTAPHSKIDTVCPTELQSGVFVESLAKNSEAEKAGLLEGDLLLSWSRGDTHGQIESPFDLLDIEVEQEPRGRVTVEGSRGEVRQVWIVGPNEWGIQARPSLPPPLLAIYREGEQLANSGKVAEGVERWQEAAVESQKYQCEWLSPWVLFHAAEAMTKERHWKESDALYQKALEFAADIGPKVKVPLLRGWARTYQLRSDLSQAEKYYRKAGAELQKTGTENLATADYLNDLGELLDDRGELDNAEKSYIQALDIQKKLAPDSLDVAVSLNHLGIVADERGDLTKSEEFYAQALAIREKLAPGSLIVAAILNNIAVVAYERGDLVNAEQYHNRALAIREALAPGSIEVAKSLANLGNIAEARGDLARSEEYLRRSLAIDKELMPGSSYVATCLNNLGEVALERGELTEAEEEYRQSLAIREALAPHGLDVAASLYNLGYLAAQRGDLAKSNTYHRQSLAIREKLAPGSLDFAASLNALGNNFLDHGDFANAEAYYQRSLKIQKQIAPGSLDEATDLLNLGITAQRQGYLSKAEEYYHQSVEIDEKVAPDSLSTAETLLGLGNLASDRSDLVGAEQFYRQALSIRKKVSPESQACAEALAALARVVRDEQQQDEALRLYGQAIDVFDSQAASLGGSSDVRAGFRARHADYYLDYADLLLSQNKPELAFRVLERSRARTSLELLSEAHVDIHRGAPSALLEKEKLLQKTLTAKSNRKIDLLEGTHSEEQLAHVNKEVAAALEQYQEVETEIRSSSPVYAALTQPKPLSTLEIQQLLDSETTLLEYALGEKRSHLFVVTSASLEAYELPKRSEIEPVARRVYELLTSQNRWIEGETDTQRNIRLAKEKRGYQKAVAALSQMILQPVAAHIEGKRLLIVADGALQYIPFAVLPMPGGDPSKPPVPLIAEHEIVNLPSASVLALLRRQASNHATAAKEVAILADPVFDRDDTRINRTKQLATANNASQTITARSLPYRLTRSIKDVSVGNRSVGSGLPRLVYSRQEADAIMAMTDPGKGMEALDFQASRKAALNKALGEYRIVHFATHGLLDTQHPELSGLVLSLVDPNGKPQNGFLDLQDIYNMDLPVDLVVLSACETALGKEINGEGLVGLTRGFMYAGAPRVVASLWKVDDVATASLMERFYKAILKEGIRPAAALRQAQLEMWRDKRWSAPYNWAAFTIQGEWK